LEIPLQWLEGKLPMPNLKQILLSNIVRKEDNRMVHSTFFYARNEGSQFIINRLAEGLNIRLNFEVNKIEKVGNYFQINGNEQFDAVIYCGDVRKMHNVLQTENAQLHNAMLETADFKSNATSNLLCEVAETDLSWLYFPENQYKNHRIIFTGNFCPSNNGNEGVKTCVVEFSGKFSESEMCEEIKKLPYQLNPLAYNFHSNSYVIQNKDTRERVLQLRQLLEPQSFYLLGRFAEWEYYNMDKCMESAMQVRDAINNFVH